MANLPIVRTDAVVDHESGSFVERRGVVEELFGALKRHWLIGSLVAAIALVAIIGTLLVLPAQYRATAMIMIQPRSTEVVKVDPVLSRLPMDADTVASERQVIESRDLIAKMATKLRLDERAEFDPNQPSLMARMLSTVAQPVHAWLPPQIGQLLDALAPEKLLEGQSHFDAVIERVRAKLDAQPINHTRVIGITFTSRDRELSAQVVNTLAQMYVANQAEIKNGVETDANRWITSNLSRLSQNATDAARRVSQYRTSHGLIDGKDSTLIKQELSELDTQLTATRVQRMAQAAKVDSLNADPAGNSAVLSSLLIQNLRQQQATLASQTVKIADRLGPENPVLHATKEQMTDIGRRIDQEITRIAGSIRRDYQATLEHENALKQQFDALKDQLAGMQDAEIGLGQLQAEATANQTLYASYLQRSKETGSTNFDIPDATLISSAAIPVTPYFPNNRYMVPLGILVALFIGLFAAFLADYRDRSFRSQSELTKALGVRVVGFVPEFGRRDQDGGNLPNPLSLLGSVMMDIYVRLFRSSGGAKCILLASALPREGKTMTGLFLAHVAAINGKRVLLLDADLRRSGLRRRLSCDGIGLTDILEGRAALVDAIVRKAGFDVIGCGAGADNPVGLLGSSKMREFINEMRRQYDLVLVDSPAIMAGPDAMVLGQIADETLFFTRWARTPREVVEVAFRHLVDGGANVIGAVLTRIDMKRIARYSVTDGMSYSKAMRRYYPMPR